MARSILLLTAVAMQVACASSPSGGADAGGDAGSPFLGYWVLQSGSVTQTCGNGAAPYADSGFNAAGHSMMTVYTMGELEISFLQLPSGQLTESSEGSTCQWTWTESGSTAKMTGTTPCAGDVTVDSQGDTEFQSTLGADSATVSDGMLSETISGTQTVTYESQTVMCTLTGSAVFASCLPTSVGDDGNAAACCSGSDDGMGDCE